jgi:diaminohydroxyphosphoribosylaminopyrimidine deaminase/5-amino-6-(5-phosphoribosylamino)uracil reductase
MSRRGDDEFWMRQAIDLANTAVGRTSPNPLVGCVLVRNAVCIGAGVHIAAGRAHAEVAALAEAGQRAEGSTAYVNLEPCAHWGRTGPCVDALVEQRVARVVSAIEDPDVRVSGRGHASLREHGVEVVVGVLESDARRVNAPYLKWKRLGIPHVTLKLASSLDGRSATAAGESKWITDEAARRDGHRKRDAVDAVVVGVGTVLADDPAMTTRLPDVSAARDPLRVVLDTNCRTPPDSRIVNVQSAAETVIVVSEDAADERVEPLLARGAEVWRVPCDGSSVSLDAVLKRLGDLGVLSLLVEGGPTVAGGFVRRRLVDRVVAYLAPKIIGGVDAPGSVGGTGFTALAEALELDVISTAVVGTTTRIEADVRQVSDMHTTNF